MVFKPFIQYIQYIDAEKKALSKVRREENQKTITNIKPAASKQLAKEPSSSKKSKGNTIMSSTKSSFTSQAAASRDKKKSKSKSGGSSSSSAASASEVEEHPAKNKTIRPKDMDADQKIDALKNEIDNLRSQVFDTNTIGNARSNPYALSNSSRGSGHAVFSLTMLSMAVLVVVVIVQRLKRRPSGTTGSRHLSSLLSFVSNASGGNSGNNYEGDDMRRSFELRPTSTSLSPEEPQILVTDRISPPTSSAAYEAPDAADVRMV